MTAQQIATDAAEDQDLIGESKYTHVMYILTLGTHMKSRRQGIASTLVRKCIEEAERNPKCGAVCPSTGNDSVAN